MTILWDLVIVVALGLLVAVSAVFVYRLVVVRRTATPAILRPSRRMDWHHGGLQYTRDEARFYRLVSLRFGADIHLSRTSIEILGRREPAGREVDFAVAGEQIVRLTGRDRRRGDVDLEVCLDNRSHTALLSWVEACSTDAVRSTPARGGGHERRRR